MIHFEQVPSSASEIQGGITLVLAVLALAGTLITALSPILLKRIRGQSDVRDDKTVENNILKEAAETAMALVGEARISATQSVEMIKGSLEIAKSQIVDLQNMIDNYKDMIAHYESAKRDDKIEIEELKSKLLIAETKKESRENEIKDLQTKLEAKEAEIANFSTKVQNVPATN